MDKTQEAAHTPGPWEVHQNHGTGGWLAGYYVGREVQSGTREWLTDDKRRIARFYTDAAARAAIAKATGTTEQPSAPAPSLALTAFIQDVEAAEEIDVQATPENGREANEQGFYEHQCPFPSDSCEADQWRQEWRDAQIDRELWEDENFYRAKATGAAA